MIMSSIYCICLSFGDFVAPVGSAAHNVHEGHILLVSDGSVCALFAAVCAVYVDPTVLWSGRS